MKIKINKKWIISPNSQCYIISRITKNKKTGKDFIKDLYFYNNIHHLLEKLIELDLQCSSVSSFAGIVNHIENFKEMIREKISLDVYKNCEVKK